MVSVSTLLCFAGFGIYTANEQAEFVEKEWAKYHVDYYINFGGNLQIPNWRTLKPEMIFAYLQHVMAKRLGPA